MDILDSRWKDAKALSAYLMGETDRHPYGLVGAASLTPPQDYNSSWDARDQGASEWGNAAGFDMTGIYWSRYQTLSKRY